MASRYSRRPAFPNFTRIAAERRRSHEGDAEPAAVCEDHRLALRPYPSRHRHNVRALLNANLVIEFQRAIDRRGSRRPALGRGQPGQTSATPTQAFTLPPCSAGAQTDSNADVLIVVPSTSVAEGVDTSGFLITRSLRTSGAFTSFPRWPAQPSPLLRRAHRPFTLPGEPAAFGLGGEGGSIARCPALRCRRPNAWQGKAARRIWSMIRTARGRSERGGPRSARPIRRRRQATSLFSRAEQTSVVIRPRTQTLGMSA